MWHAVAAVAANELRLLMPLLSPVLLGLADTRAVSMNCKAGNSCTAESLYRDGPMDLVEAMGLTHIYGKCPGCWHSELGVATPDCQSGKGSSAVAICGRALATVHRSSSHSYHSN